MPVHIQHHGEVVEISLDWPEVRNALGPQQGRELRQTLEQICNQDKPAAIVLSARGKAFCAGGNLPEIVRLAQQGPEAVKDTIYGEFQGVFRVIRESRIPILAAVDGAAVGFGCDLALSANITFIGTHGWIAQGWIKAGLIPATGGTHYVVRRGGQQALWQLLTADRVDGPTAERWGLAVSCDNARDTALAAAERLATLPREPLQALTHLATLENLDEHLGTALRYQTDFITSPEFSSNVSKLLGR